MGVGRFWRYKIAQWGWYLRRQENQRLFLRGWVEGQMPFLRSLKVAFRHYRGRYASEFLPVGLVLVMVLVMLVGAWTVPAAASVVAQVTLEHRPAVVWRPEVNAPKTQAPQQPRPVVDIPVPAPSPSPVHWTEYPISIDDARRPAPPPSPKIQVVDEGWAAHYSPGVMWQVIAVRQEGQVLHPLPPFEPDVYLGFVARPDCAEIGQEVWLDFYQGWVGPFLVTDCAHPADRPSIESRGIVTELDYTSAVQFGVARTGGRMVRVGQVEKQAVSAGH